MPEPHRRRAVDAARGLVALVATVALVAGVPAALALGIGSPLPDHAVAPAAAVRALGAGDVPDSLVVTLLALACWLLWCELAVSLAVEAVAYRRGRRAGRIPLAGGVQRGASGLIAGIALLGGVVARRPRAAVPQLPADLAAAHGTAVWIPSPGPPVPQPASRTSPPARTGPSSLPTYEVQPRDTLWDIAERHLRDPFRWRDIVQLNEGRVQADGGRLTGPDVLRAGWRLDLPADATGLGPRSVPDHATSDDHESVPTAERPGSPVTLASWSGDPRHD
jgi:nucleoid-associated protein YgaU